MGALGDFVAAIALKFIQAWLARADLQQKAKLELALDIERVGNEAARRALEWKADAASRSDGGAGLRVREGAGGIALPGEDSGPSGGAN